MLLQLSVFLLSLCLAGAAPEAEAGPAAYASDFTQYFAAEDAYEPLKDDDGHYYDFLNKNQKDREGKSYANQAYAQTYEYNQVPSAYVVQPVVQPVVAPVTGNQYHAQDEAGQYSFGYSDPNSVRQEVSADGVVRGGYKYLDSDGLLQTVEYIADEAGFRVAATNLPQAPVELPVQVQDTPEVVEAKRAHYAAIGAAPVIAQPVAAPIVQQVQVPVAAPAPAQAYQVQAPVAPVAPVAQAVVPVVQAVSTDGTQYHSQDDIGQYSFGYSNGESVKQEVKTADGVVRGAYQYVDANGIVQTVNYIADALGFRVGATNLPVHHVEGASAEPVQEVQAVEEPVVAAYKGVMEPAVDYSYLPYATSYGYNLPAPHVVPFGSSSGLDPITQGLDAATQGMVEAAPVVAAPAAA